MQRTFADWISALGGKVRGTPAMDGAKAIEAGGNFGEFALFPDLLPPVRPETAVADSWVVSYTLPAAAV
jgi:hypothetical protein